MERPENIVIFHPAAIGDAMLATPVSAILKRNFPESRITYWSHESLKPVIDMCPAVDAFSTYQKGNAFKLASNLKVLRPDLFVDLSSNPLKGKLMAFLTAIKTVHYKKKPDGVEPIQHAVDNFIDSVRPIVQDIPTGLFPTIFPTEAATKAVRERLYSLNANKNPLIAVVPGVGSVRPNRSWQSENWIALIDRILYAGTHTPVLVGGKDEVKLAERIKGKCHHSLINLCGQLDLKETATLLKECDVVVSADTGPAHIAVAVGTPVVGLYGPTRAERSGPYGCDQFLISKSSDCQCMYEKECKLTRKGTAGDCMAKINIMDVWLNIDRAMNSNH